MVHSLWEYDNSFLTEKLKYRKDIIFIELNHIFYSNKQLENTILMDIYQHLYEESSINMMSVHAIQQLNKMEINKLNYFPHYVIGDLKQITDDRIHLFDEKFNTKFINDSNECTNHLTKCLSYLVNVVCVKDKIPFDYDVVVFGCADSRLDAIMQNINSLFQWERKFNRVILISTTAEYTLLRPGNNKIVPNRKVESNMAGLIPIGYPCPNVTTGGLRRDLNNQIMKFGGIIKSSNEIEGITVVVETEKPLLWTTTLLLGKKPKEKVLSELK